MNIRFKELVKKAGQPEEKSLWTDPKRDRGFQKAVKENRVLTIVQQPAAKKKEFGEIGFHEERYATYLVFPKPLPKEPDSKVIGIDYSLIGQPEVRDAVDSSKLRPVRTPKPASPRPAEVDFALKSNTRKARTEAPKPKPPKTFEVLVRRTAILETTVTVEAKNNADAKKGAVAAAKKQPFDLSKAVFRMETLSAKP